MYDQPNCLHSHGAPSYEVPCGGRLIYRVRATVNYATQSWQTKSPIEHRPDPANPLGTLTAVKDSQLQSVDIYVCSYVQSI